MLLRPSPLDLACERRRNLRGGATHRFGDAVLYSGGAAQAWALALQEPSPRTADRADERADERIGS